MRGNVNMDVASNRQPLFFPKYNQNFKTEVTSIYFIKMENSVQSKFHYKISKKP
jgi:hypothetical protein